MSIKDNSGQTYHIPLGSPVKFGIFYNPCNNHQRAKMGYAFATVSDIVDSEKPPHVIRATMKSLGNGGYNSVFPNEVLIVRRVGIGATRQENYVNVFSLLSSKNF